jgi:predicted  nucleic acid-binding Zn-ribbon protein
MKRLSSIFKEGPRQDEPALDVESFVVVCDDGRFCVLRLTLGSARLLDAEPIELLAGATVFAAIEDEEGDDRAVEFMVPSSTVQGNFAIRLGDAGHALPRPVPMEGDDSRTTEDAHHALQRQLLDQGRRLASLRASLRSERERAARLEDELEQARESFDQGLLSVRSDHHAIELRLSEAEAEATSQRLRREELERERDTVAGPLEEQIARLTAERDELHAEVGQERADRIPLEAKLKKAHENAVEHERALQAAREHETELQRERDVLKEALESTRSELEAAREELTGERDAHRDDADLIAQRDKARERVAALEQEMNSIDERRETAESALADVQRKLSEERAAVEELTARASAAEKALDQALSARYAAEQRAREAEAGRSVAPEPAAANGEHPSDEDVRDLRDVEMVAPDGSPAVTARSLVRFSVDALAEAYAFALDAGRTRDRAGDHGQGEQWRALARAITDEAATRSALRNERGSTAARGRAVDRRRARLRAQLRAAAIGD